MRQRKLRNLGLYRLGDGFYRAELWSLANGLYGDCTNATRQRIGRIRIDKVQPPVELIDTLLHEALHAIFQTMGEDKIRRLAGQLSVFLVDVLRRIEEE